MTEFCQRLARSELAMALLLILIAAAARWLPHVDNFTPIGALALFSGAYLSRRWFWLVPLAALFLGDLHNGLYNGVVLIAVYAGFLASAAIGRWLLLGRATVGPIALAVVVGALSFWVVSNLGSWLAFRPLTVAGLAQCYVDGLPYLLRSLVGDAVYAALLFGVYGTLLKIGPLQIGQSQTVRPFHANRIPAPERDGNRLRHRTP